MRQGNSTRRAAGEKHTLSIRSARKGKALLTVENKKILEYYFIELDAPYKEKKFPLPVKTAYAPSISIDVMAVYGNDTYACRRLSVDLPVPDKTLQVALLPQAKELPPSTPAKLTINVKQQNGKGKKARLFVYAVNEGSRLLVESWNYSMNLVKHFYYHSWRYHCENIPLLRSQARKNDLLSVFGRTLWQENTGGIIGRVID
ncbi:MAG: hypothetical protein GY757_39580, partial [bacterium]|nr:hypothetical protein [bacterium]